MFKACRALLRVATIVGTICGALILACVPAFFVIGFSNTIHNMLVDAMKEGTVTVEGTSASYETIAFVIQGMFIGLGFTLLIVGAMCVVNAILSLRTRNEPTRGRYIACIVTGALSTDFSLIAGIFGLICLGREERRKKLEE